MGDPSRSPQPLPPLAETSAPPAGDGATSTPPRADLLAIVASAIREGDMPRKNRIFVNRNLRMDQIDHIGFDMDYTLAIYNQPKIEALSVRCTLDKLIEKRGYPEA